MADRSKPPANRRRKERRAFSAARAPGAVETGGDPALAAELAQALRAPRSEDRAAASATHAVHAYPARMHPATARRLIGVVVPQARDRAAVVLDPFCGSGTTLVEACRAGHRAIGVDANPLAVLIARAKTWLAPAARQAELRDLAHGIAGLALAQGKAARRAGHRAAPLRVPRSMVDAIVEDGPGSPAGRAPASAVAPLDPDERNRRLAHWFAPHVRRELEAMAGEIDRVRERDRELADVLIVVLSGILYKVSRRASDSDPSPVERRIGRGQAARLFSERADQLVAGLKQLAAARRLGPPAARAIAPVAVYCGDARALGDLGLGDQPAACAVVTSPPYAGTYDYAEQHRLRLDFLGIDSQEFGHNEMGARRQFEGDGEARRRARRRWNRALAGAMAEIARVTRPGGRVSLLMGDSIAGDRAMWADEAIAAAIDGVDLRVVGWAAQRRPALGSKESQLFGDRGKRETLFLLESGAARP